MIKIKNKKNLILIVSPVIDSVNFLNDYIKQNTTNDDVIIFYDKKETLGYYDKIKDVELINIRFTRKYFSFFSLIPLIKNIFIINKKYKNINVILNSPNSILYLFFFKFLLNKNKIFLIIHGLLEARSILIRALYKTIVNTLIIFTHKTISVNSSYTFIFSKKIYYLQNIGFGIINERYNEIRNHKKIRKKCNEINLGYVGRYSKEKGIDRFLLLKKILDKNLKQYKFNFYAYGDKKIIDKQIISKKILYDKKEIAQFYSLIDILIFPSRGDSVGLAQLEALSSGALVLASNNNGSNQLKQIFNDYMFIIDRWDKKNIILIIEKILDNLESSSLKLIKKNKSNFVLENWEKIFQ